MIRIVKNPSQRQSYIDEYLSLDGLSHIKEDPLAAYCAISLTLTPDELKPILLQRQNILMEKVLKPAGLTAYDPATAPYSPDNLDVLPNEVYAVDSAKIAGARFFVGHNLLASTGVGIEQEKAKTLNRVAVILMDKNVRISRMQPHRAIYLQYENFERQAHEFIPVFLFLKHFEPAIGFNGNVPALLGFGKDGIVVDLEQEVYTRFPQLQYRFNGNIPIVRLRAENPELFYEYKFAVHEAKLFK